MTEKFKEYILNWITNNFQVTQADNTPQFSQTIELENNIRQYVLQYIDTSPYFSKYIQIDEFDTYALFGYYVSNNKQYGFIVILDKQLLPLQFIDSYSSGVKFQKIYDVNFGDDNGFFLIENLMDADNRIRFVILNNILIPNEEGQYEVEIQKSYSFPDSELTEQEKTMMRSIGIYKLAGQSRYLFLFSTSILSPIIIELEVNVGSDNVWNFYRGDNSLSELYYTYDSAYYDYHEDKLNVILPAASNDSVNSKYYEIIIRDNMLVVDDSKTLQVPDVPTSYFGFLNPMTIKLNSSISYIAYRVPNESYDAGYNKVYMINDGNFTLLDTTEYAEEEYTLDTNFNFFYRFNNHLFLRIKIGPVAEGGNGYYLCLIDDDNLYKNKIEISSPITWNSPFFVTQKYNLYSFYLQSDELLYSQYIIFNNNDYVGLPYDDFNSMIPTYVNLRDEQGNLLYSRNLYNLSIHDNSTIATVEIPNNLLNENQIYSEELIGQTNRMLINVSKTLSKNVYEKVFINFNNQINVINNNGNLNQKMINASNKINNSISTGTYYQYLGISFAKVNYQNTNEIISLELKEIDYDNFTAKYCFSFYAKEPIKSIEILSNDQKVVYAKIMGDQFIKDKAYSITQNIKVG